jgi:hypothetical protein
MLAVGYKLLVGQGSGVEILYNWAIRPINGSQYRLCLC